MAGWSALGCGVLAFLGPIAMLGVITYLFAAMSLFAAIFAIQGMATGNERFIKYLTSSQRATLWGTSIVGIVLSALGVFGVAALLR
jgi:hypothetical protein